MKVLKALRSTSEDIPRSVPQRKLEASTPFVGAAEFARRPQPLRLAGRLRGPVSRYFRVDSANSLSQGLEIPQKATIAYDYRCYVEPAS